MMILSLISIDLYPTRPWAYAVSNTLRHTDRIDSFGGFSLMVLVFAKEREAQQYFPLFNSWRRALRDSSKNVQHGSLTAGLESPGFHHTDSY